MNATWRDSTSRDGAAGQACALGRAISGLAKLFILLLSLTGLGAWSYGANAVTDTYTVSGTWTAPAGVTSVDVEVWGGGGAGGGNNTNVDGTSTLWV